MKLKHWIAFGVAGAMAAWTVASAMWIFTQKDLLEILVVTMMVSPVLAILPFALMEENGKKDKKRFKIYTLTEEEFYGRKVS